MHCFAELEKHKYHTLPEIYHFKLQPVTVPCDSTSSKIRVQSSDKPELAEINFVRLRVGCFPPESGNRGICGLCCPAVS